jgi:hypothetical protein
LASMWMPSLRDIELIDGCVDSPAEITAAGGTRRFAAAARGLEGSGSPLFRGSSVYIAF